MICEPCKACMRERDAAIARAESAESELSLARLDGNSALVDLAAAVKRAEAAESAIEPAYRRGLEDGRKSSTVMRLRAEAAESGRAAAWARCETLERVHEELRTELTARAEAAEVEIDKLRASSTAHYTASQVVRADAAEARAAELQTIAFDAQANADAFYDEAKSAQARIAELAGDVVELEAERVRWTTEAALGRRNGEVTERAAVVTEIETYRDRWDVLPEPLRHLLDWVQSRDHLAPAQPTEDSHE